MKALCLDLGTTTGWALADWHPHSNGTDPRIISGTISFKPGRYEGGGMRYLRFRYWLDEMLPHGATAIFYEEVRRHSAVDAAHVYGGLMATLTAWCEDHSIAYTGIPVGTIKKHISGRGNANKRLVIESVKRLGYDPKDDNEADAIALASCILHNQPGFTLSSIP
jgi:Holliday junction resolvasome RuvABC endonuclease subunit